MTCSHLFPRAWRVLLPWVPEVIIIRLPSEPAKRLIFSLLQYVNGPLEPGWSVTWFASSSVWSFAVFGSIVIGQRACCFGFNLSISLSGWGGGGGGRRKGRSPSNFPPPPSPNKAGPIFSLSWFWFGGNQPKPGIWNRNQIIASSLNL